MDRQDQRRQHLCIDGYGCNGKVAQPAPGSAVPHRLQPAPAREQRQHHNQPVRPALLAVPQLQRIERQKKCRQQRQIPQQRAANRRHHPPRHLPHQGDGDGARQHRKIAQREKIGSKKLDPRPDQKIIHHPALPGRDQRTDRVLQRPRRQLDRLLLHLAEFTRDQTDHPPAKRNQDHQGHPTLLRLRGPTRAVARRVPRLGRLHKLKSDRRFRGQCHGRE